MIRWVLIFTMLVSLGARPQPAPRVSDFPPGREGLMELIALLYQADHATRMAISEQLHPSLADCEAIFEGKMAKRIYQLERRLYRRWHPVVRPYSPEQTIVACWQSDRAELLSYQGGAQHFPGGYRELARHLTPGLPVYRVKFLEPGRRLGAAFDLFTYVNGRWCLLYQPWRVVLK